MENNPFQFTRLKDGQKIRSTSLNQIIDSQDPTNQKWLFVSPHDDDACIGAGLWIQAAIHAGIEVYLVVVTDGRMGYCHTNQQESIIETRRMETYDSCAILGLNQQYIKYIDYPDGGLFTLQGRWQTGRILKTFAVTLVYKTL